MTSQEEPRTQDAYSIDDAALRLLFDRAPANIGVIELDENNETVFVFANPAQAQRIGVSVEAIPGLRPSSMAPRRVVELWQAKYLEAKATGKAVSFEIRGSDAGPYYSMWASIMYLGDSPAGRPRFGFVSTDFSDRRRAEDRLNSILQSSPGFILTLDQDCKIVSLHGPFSGAKAAIGLDVLSLVPAEQAPPIRALYEQVLRTGEPAHYESSNQEPDPEARSWYASVVGPLRSDGEIVGLTIVATDITERKRLERAVREALLRANKSAEETARQNDLLEREIEERRRTEALLLRQQEEIRALSTPLLQVWDGVLALPVVGALDGARVAQLMETLLGEIVRARIRVAILDLTGATMVDTATAGHLLRIARAVSLLGSRCVLSGISPRIAQTMTAIGVSAESIRTFGTLRDALKDALERSGAAASRG